LLLNTFNLFGFPVFLVSGDHRYSHIPNCEWGNERNETCYDLSYNLFIWWRKSGAVGG
jgi:hypothetical protein